MQVKETLSEGLKREYEVVVLAADLDQRVNAKLDEIKGRVNIAGFRPGKVPMSHLKRVYGKSVMSEVIQQAVNDSNQKIVDDGKFKLAMELASSKEEAPQEARPQPGAKQKPGSGAKGTPASEEE